MNADFTIWPAELAIETRARGRGRSLRASFPLGRTATTRSSGRVRKERFAGGNGGASMSWQAPELAKVQAEAARVIESEIAAAQKAALIEALEDELERRNTHLLIGHDYNRAIADMRTGNLDLDFSDEAVSIRAALPDPGDAPSWVEDAVLAVRGGQLRGVSPGFNVPAGKGAERLVPEAGAGDALVREITDSVVFEYSLVARPTYASSAIDVRAFPVVKPKKRRAVWWL